MGILGTAICSLISYITLFEKPHAVKTVVAVLSFDGDIPGQIAEVIRGNDGMHDFGRLDYLHHGGDKRGNVVLTLLATILGASHVAAWNFSFPTRVDKIMWRVNSVITCVLLIGSWITLALVYFVGISVRCVCRTRHIIWDRASDTFMKGLLALIILLYVVPRMILAVLMIRLLFHIPPGAFKTSWADNLPDI